MQEITSYKPIFYSVTSAVYCISVGSSVKVSVKTLFYAVFMKHFKHIIIAAIAEKRWIMQKHHRVLACLLRRLDRECKSACFPCQNLLIRRLAVIAYPTPSSAYTVPIIAVMIIMQDIYGIKTVLCEKFIHFVLGVPGSFPTRYHRVSPQCPQDELCSASLFQALSHSQTSRRIYPLVYLYPATNAGRQWQIGSRFFLHSRNFMYYPDHSCTYYFCSKKLQKERCTNGEG